MVTYRDIAHQNNAKTSDIHKEIRYVISSCIHLCRKLFFSCYTDCDLYTDDFNDTSTSQADRYTAEPGSRLRTREAAGQVDPPSNNPSPSPHPSPPPPLSWGQSRGPLPETAAWGSRLMFRPTFADILTEKAKVRVFVFLSRKPLMRWKFRVGRREKDYSALSQMAIWIRGWQQKKRAHMYIYFSFCLLDILLRK